MVRKKEKRIGRSGSDLIRVSIIFLTSFLMNLESDLTHTK
jgi:hypothetical protein